MLGVLLKTLDGAEEYRLRFTTNAMVAFEEETGTTVLSVVKVFDKGNEAEIRFATVRMLAWACLLDGRPGITQVEAGEVIDACGGVARVMPAIGEAIRAAFPEEPGGKTRGNGRRAGKKPASTGAA
ncbi:hypothetical protein [Mangrovicoccus algicola]|uniref:Gene transfer agent family protein n=1 Tax=Mangrovicoccus algicola TaxID=2771008 RepID=A0A8J6Z4I6_9RHOB|nr:hypothetical protein [Mangrovicoccus algicola]MBE3637464.1 hypothetical protein [Mangrovicoccus algicola]